MTDNSLITKGPQVFGEKPVAKQRPWLFFCDG